MGLCPISVSNPKGAAEMKIINTVLGFLFFGCGLMVYGAFITYGGLLLLCDKFIGKQIKL